MGLKAHHTIGYGVHLPDVKGHELSDEDHNALQQDGFAVTYDSVSGDGGIFIHWEDWAIRGDRSSNTHFTRISEHDSSEMFEVRKKIIERWQHLLVQSTNHWGWHFTTTWM